MEEMRNGSKAMKKARSSVKNKKPEKKACDVDDNTMVTNDSGEMKNGESGSGMRG